MKGEGMSLSSAKDLNIFWAVFGEILETVAWL